MQGLWDGTQQIHSLLSGVHGLVGEKGSVLVSCGCPNKGSQTGWLKITETYCLMVLEIRGLKSRCGQGQAPSGASCGQTVPCLFQLLVAPGVAWLLAVSLCLHKVVSPASVYLWVSSVYLVYGHLLKDLVPPSPVIQDDLMISRSLTTSCKVLLLLFFFLNDVTFIGSTHLMSHLLGRAGIQPTIDSKQENQQNITITAADKIGQGSSWRRGKGHASGGWSRQAESCRIRS